MLIHRLDNDVFDVGCGNPGDRSYRCRLGLSLEMRQRDVIAIADSSFGGWGRDHPVARIVVQLLTLAMYAASLPVIAMITPAQAATKKHWRPREPWYVGQPQALSRRTQGRSARASPEASIARCGLLQLMRI